MELDRLILSLNSDIEVQASIYDVPFDLQKSIALSKNSKEKNITYRTHNKRPEVLTCLPILDIIHNPSKTIGIVIFPNEKCAILSQTEVEFRHNNQTIKENPFFDKIKSNMFVLTRPFDGYGNNKGKPIIEGIILETKESQVKASLRYLEATAKTSFSGAITEIDSLLSLKLLKERKRDKTIDHILYSLQTQFRSLSTARTLEGVIFEYPSPNLLRVSLKIDTFNIMYEHPIELNPSVTQVAIEATEDASFWLEALNIEGCSNEQWILERKKERIKKGIKHLMDSKDWFIFGINDKNLKVTKKESNSGDRFYIDGIMTKQDHLIDLLMLLFKHGKKYILNEAKCLHSIPQEIQVLLRDGIKGKIIDLEGEIQIDLRLLRRLNRYSFFLRGSEYKIRGGLVGLKKLRNAVEGKGRSSSLWTRLNVTSSRDYRYFLYLLKKLIGAKSYINFYKECKSDSKEKQVLCSKNLWKFIESKPEIERNKDITLRDVIIINTNGNLFYIYSSHDAWEIRGTRKFHIINYRGADYGDITDQKHFQEENLKYLIELILADKQKVTTYGQDFKG